MPFFNTLAATTILRVCVVLPPNPRPLLAHGRAAAKQAGIPVSTIAFGTTRAPSTSRLRAPARARRQADTARPRRRHRRVIPCRRIRRSIATGLPRHRPASRLHHRTAHHQLTLPRQRPSLRAGRRRNRDALGRPAAVGARMILVVTRPGSGTLIRWARQAGRSPARCGESGSRPRHHVAAFGAAKRARAERSDADADPTPAGPPGA